MSDSLQLVEPAEKPAVTPIRAHRQADVVRFLEDTLAAAKDGRLTDFVGYGRCGLDGYSAWDSADVATALALVMRLEHHLQKFWDEAL